MKQLLLDYAEVTDAWRVVPRLLLGGYAYLVWYFSMWYHLLPDPTDNQKWFIGAIWAAAAGLTKWYFDSGRKWTT